MILTMKTKINGPMTVMLLTLIPFVIAVNMQMIIVVSAVGHFAICISNWALVFAMAHTRKNKLENMSVESMEDNIIQPMCPKCGKRPSYSIDGRTFALCSVCGAEAIERFLYPRKPNQFSQIKLMEHEFDMSLKEYQTLADVREELQLLANSMSSQSALARKMGISLSYLRGVLAGKSKPGPKVMKFLKLKRVIVYQELNR